MSLKHAFSTGAITSSRGQKGKEGEKVFSYYNALWPSKDLQYRREIQFLGRGQLDLKNIKKVS